MTCPCPPWFPNDGSPAGSYDWFGGDVFPPVCHKNDPRPRHYKTEIEYTCPLGYVMDTADLDKTMYPESNTLTYKCERWGDWSPAVKPRCIRKSLALMLRLRYIRVYKCTSRLAINCTDDPYKIQTGPGGIWDWDGKNKTFTANVTYKCPIPGWGYPSNGKSSVVSTCQANKEWSIDHVEICERTKLVRKLVRIFSAFSFPVLPCETAPPDAPAGGTSWYNLKATKYKCPNGYNFDGHHYFTYSNCTPAKYWLPRQVPKCVREYIQSVKLVNRHWK